MGLATGIRGIWSLKASSMDAFDTYLVLTFVGETRVLAITPDDELDEAELSGFDAEAQVRPRKGPYTFSVLSIFYVYALSLHPVMPCNLILACIINHQRQKLI
jgi:Mono-functional DNA-alkylating methyl methanesulfonate N-term